jgi:hypothetical protein
LLSSGWEVVVGWRIIQIRSLVNDLDDMSWLTGESPGVGEEWVTLHIVPVAWLMSKLIVVISIWLGSDFTL